MSTIRSFLWETFEHLDDDLVRLLFPEKFGILQITVQQCVLCSLVWI